VCELRIIDAAEHGDFQEKPAEPAFAAELFVDGFWFEAGTFETFEAALERIRTSCEPVKDVSPGHLPQGAEGAAIRRRARGDLGSGGALATYDDIDTVEVIGWPEHRRLAHAGRKKRINGPPPQPTMPAVRHAIVDLILRPPSQRCPHCRRRIREKPQHKPNLPK
jgi:hypothetical protein